MTTATAVGGSRISTLDQGQGRGDPLHIVCPTYWYPQHADDTQATYVHDINRHLVRRGHRVTVVAPGHPSLAPKEIFDGVEAFYRRFYFRAPKIAAILGEMVRSPEMMRRRLREGLEFFRFLRERQDLAA